MRSGRGQGGWGDEEWEGPGRVGGVRSGRGQGGWGDEESCQRIYIPMFEVAVLVREGKGEGVGVAMEGEGVGVAIR